MKRQKIWIEVVYMYLLHVHEKTVYKLQLQVAKCCNVPGKSNPYMNENTWNIDLIGPSTLNLDERRPAFLINLNTSGQLYQKPTDISTRLIGLL